MKLDLYATGAGGGGWLSFEVWIPFFFWIFFFLLSFLKNDGLIFCFLISLVIPFFFFFFQPIRYPYLSFCLSLEKWEILLHSAFYCCLLRGWLSIYLVFNSFFFFSPLSCFLFLEAWYLIYDTRARTIQYKHAYQRHQAVLAYSSFIHAYFIGTHSHLAFIAFFPIIMINIKNIKKRPSIRLRSLFCF